VQGESLLPLMKPADGPLSATAPTRGDRTAYAETDYPHTVFGWSSLRALRTDKYLLIAAPRTELYDLSVDPHAKRNLAASAGNVSKTLTAKLDAFRRGTARSAQAAKAEVRPELAESLAALGYVSSSGASNRAGEELIGADPKDKIEIANRVQEANLASEEGRPQDAIRIFEQLVAKDPTVAVVHRALGMALMQQQDSARAVSALRKAVELRPDASTYRYELGLALLKTGDLPAAKSELEAAVALSSPGNPHSAAIHHFTLAGVHNRMGRAAEAIKELRVAVQLDPDSYDANLTLGRLLSMGGEATAAVPYLQQAARLEPLSPDPHRFLADAYGQLGQQGNATQERREAERLLATGKR
jgi:tetratricopeptide (TPR) repeat protein